MIVTLTANPSIDRTVTLAGRLDRGAVLRAVGASDQPGGKGVNISRAATAAGIPTTAVVPAGAGTPFVRDLQESGIDCCPIGPDTDVRVNLTLTEPDGTTTKVNAAGARLEPDTLDGLQRCLLDLAGRADWVVLAGSLPPGAPDSWYADLVAALRRRRTRVAVDTSEAPLQALVQRLPDAAPHLMKPNGHELASLTGADPDLLEQRPVEAARAARQLVGEGVDAVLATLGGRGAVLVTGQGAWCAEPPPTTVVSTVGAGDSSLFGYLLGHLKGLTPDRRLALAVAYGSAAAGLPGTTIPTPTQACPDTVSVRPLDLTRGD